jgi:hypothetical protein
MKTQLSICYEILAKHTLFELHIYALLVLHKTACMYIAVGASAIYEPPFHAKLVRMNITFVLSFVLWITTNEVQKQ